MNARYGVPWLPLDALKMALHHGAPSLGVHPDQDDVATADRMWPFVEPVLDHLLFEGRDHLVEGVDLRPATVADYIADMGSRVRTCFLGYPDIDVGTKVDQVAAHRGPPTDWLHRRGPYEVRRYLQVSLSVSRHLRDERARVGLPFIDTGRDFVAGLEKAEAVLTSPD